MSLRISSGGVGGSYRSDGTPVESTRNLAAGEKKLEQYRQPMEQHDMHSSSILL